MRNLKKKKSIYSQPIERIFFTFVAANSCYEPFNILMLMIVFRILYLKSSKILKNL